MNKRMIIPIILAVISLVLVMVGYIILPEQVVIQFSAGSSGNSTAPKLFAILIPTILGFGGAVISLAAKNNEEVFKKSIPVSVIGIGTSVFMILSISYYNHKHRQNGGI